MARHVPRCPLPGPPTSAAHAGRPVAGLPAPLLALQAPVLALLPAALLPGRLVLLGLYPA
jgi:hypothetical protein